MSENSEITVDKTGVITYYAVTLDEIDYTVTDMYDANTDYTERTFLELETQKEPTIEIQNKISQAIADFEADS
ncbi:hypothetical protein IH922_03545 [candidate division KSB1 bacterium]|nr:hypothetical protein [candidate division KSB1 bacterium]